MAFLLSYVRNIFSSAFTGSRNSEHGDIVDGIEELSSGKRRQNENLPEVVISKRRKLDIEDCDGLENIPSLTNDLMKMSMNRRLRSTRSNSRKTLGAIDFDTNINVKKTNEHNSYGDNDLASCKVVLRRTESDSNIEAGHRNVNVINTRQASLLRATKPFSTHMCHRSPSCLDRIHREQDKATLFEMVKKFSRASVHKRKSLPLTTSTTHNTKRNDQVIANTATNKGYFLRQFTSPLIRPSPLETIDLTHESVADRTVIDLTGDDNDEDQRQMIKTSVINSQELKDFKSSFVGKYSPVVDPDFITNLLKKYEAKQRNLDSQVQRTKKTLQKNQEEINKSLVEILEKRLVLKEHVAEEKPTKDLAPIDASMLEEIHKILSSHKKPLVQIKDTGIKVQDIYTLHDRGWLNDEVINAYMNLIKMRWESNQDTYPKVHCFNTFFYPQLQNRGYCSVRRWTKKVDIFDHTIIIIPIHLGNHWCLAEVRTEEKVIRYYDSLGSPNNRCLETTLQYLVDEFEDKKGADLNAADWQVINVPRDEIPSQKNAYDCGVFACTYAEHITRNAPFNFVQEDMSYFREKMTYEILTAKLLL